MSSPELLARLPTPSSTRLPPAMSSAQIRCVHYRPVLSSNPEVLLQYFQPLALHLLDIAPMMGVLNGVVMEIQDCAMPLVRETIATDDPNVAFKDIDAAFLVGAMPRKEGMERKDLLAANVKIFKVQGEALDKFAKKSVKVNMI